MSDIHYFIKGRIKTFVWAINNIFLEQMDNNKSTEMLIIPYSLLKVDLRELII